MRDDDGERESKKQDVRKLHVIPYDGLFGNFDEARKIPRRLARAAREAARERSATEETLQECQNSVE